MRLTWVGHATMLIELDGCRFLTDPLLTRWAGFLRRQCAPVDAAVTRDLDAVLVSHAHMDHCHLPSLRLVRGAERLIVPSGLRGFLDGRGYRQVSETRPGDRLTIGTVEIEVVTARHGERRRYSRTRATPQGFVLRGSRTVYFPGDTGLFPEMADIDSAIDVVLMPIWGWGPTLGEGHLDPRRAAEALTLLRPKVAVPIHWGTYFLAGLPWRRHVALRTPPTDFQRHTRALAPEVDVRVLRPGDSTEL